MKIRGFICLVLLFVGTLPAQNGEFQTEPVRKGKFYLFWGWNRGWFTRSDIHFQGNGYDFMLDNVIACDRQSPFDAKVYFNPVKFTIPQYNYRFGYGINDKWDVSLGMDHMKYVMLQYQRVKITGTISNTDSGYDGTYDHGDIVLADDFLRFEHTDGLNYLNAELRRNFEVFRYKKIGFGILAGGGAGTLIPRTNTTLLNKARYDEFHVSGFGLGLVTGMNVTFFDRFFFQTELKGGWIDMPDIRTTMSRDDRAKQHFFFGQWNFSLGGYINPARFRAGK